MIFLQLTSKLFIPATVLFTLSGIHSRSSGCYHDRTMRLSAFTENLLQSYTLRFQLQSRRLAGYARSQTSVTRRSELRLHMLESNSNNNDEELFEQLFSNSRYINQDGDVSEDLSQHEKQIRDELLWRSVRIRLEEDHHKRFMNRLASKPRKLPYKDARLWVQANLGADTKEEFFEMVANGNLRTPYIPKRPDIYYGEQGTWISWDHFLNGIFEVGNCTAQDKTIVKEKLSSSEAELNNSEDDVSN